MHLQFFCVCVTYLFSIFNYIWVTLLLLLQQPPKLPLLRPFLSLAIHRCLFRPCCNMTLPLRSCSLPSSSISCCPSRPHLPGPLASGSIASGGLTTSMYTTVTSLIHPTDSTSVGCMPPCTWHHGGEGCWISPSLVKPDPLWSHPSTNTSASDYY